jgi:hypothetical protein
LVPQRDGTLQAELRKQQNNELMRRQFAEKANSVGPWIERQMDAVASIAMGMQVRLFKDFTILLMYLICFCCHILSVE